jgi:hypothetical protein
MSRIDAIMTGRLTRPNLGRRDPRRKTPLANRGIMYVVKAMALALAVVALPLGPAFADETPKPRASLPPPTVRPPGDDRALRLTFGGGAAYRRVAGAAAPAFPLELTLVWEPFSISTGAVITTSEGLAHAYFEVGVWAAVSVGGGLGYGAQETTTGRKEAPTWHLFLGLPIPLSEKFESLVYGKWFPYLLPYYRPSWGPWPGTAHEAGVMLKMSYTLIPGRLGTTDL